MIEGVELVNIWKLGAKSCIYILGIWRKSCMVVLWPIVAMSYYSNLQLKF